MTKPEGGAQQRAENLCLRERLCHCGLQWRRRRDGRNSIGKLDPIGLQIESLDMQSEGVTVSPWAKPSKRDALSACVARKLADDETCE